jgi:hypothetical protein
MCYVSGRINSRALVLREACIRSSKALRPFSCSTVIATSSHPPTSHMSSKSKDQFYAFQKHREWDLPSSEEREAVERTRQVVRDNAREIRDKFGNDRSVDWVIM